jgi:hypothetical protein
MAHTTDAGRFRVTLLPHRSTLLPALLRPLAAAGHVSSRNRCVGSSCTPPSGRPSHQHVRVISTSESPTRSSHRHVRVVDTSESSTRPSHRPSSDPAASLAVARGGALWGQECRGPADRAMDACVVPTDHSMHSAQTDHSMHSAQTDHSMHSAPCLRARAWSSYTPLTFLLSSCRSARSCSRPQCVYERRYTARRA